MITRITFKPFKGKNNLLKMELKYKWAAGFKYARLLIPWH